MSLDVEEFARSLNTMVEPEIKAATRRLQKSVEERRLNTTANGRQGSPDWKNMYALFEDDIAIRASIVRGAFEKKVDALPRLSPDEVPELRQVFIQTLNETLTGLGIEKGVAFVTNPTTASGFRDTVEEQEAAELEEINIKLDAKVRIAVGTPDKRIKNPVSLQDFINTLRWSFEAAYARKLFKRKKDLRSWFANRGLQYIGTQEPWDEAEFAHRFMDNFLGRGADISESWRETLTKLCPNSLERLYAESIRSQSRRQLDALIQEYGKEAEAFFAEWGGLRWREELSKDAIGALEATVMGDIAELLMTWPQKAKQPEQSIALGAQPGPIEEAIRRANDESRIRARMEYQAQLDAEVLRSASSSLPTSPPSSAPVMPQRDWLIENYKLIAGGAIALVVAIVLAWQAHAQKLKDDRDKLYDQMADKLLHAATTAVAYWEADSPQKGDSVVQDIAVTGRAFDSLWKTLRRADYAEMPWPAKEAIGNAQSSLPELELYVRRLDTTRQKCVRHELTESSCGNKSQQAEAGSILPLHANKVSAGAWALRNLAKQ